MDPPKYQIASAENKSKYEDILANNGIYDKISHVLVKDSNLVGEGFCSETEYLTVIFENGDKPPLKLFVKNIITNPVHQELMGGQFFYEKETRFLMEYAPEAHQLCISKGQNDLLDFLPMCYYGDSSTIVLENLVEDKGYVRLKKEERQDKESTTFALTSLAKFHAVGHAMIQQHGGHKPFFEKYLHLDFDGFSLPKVEATFHPMLENTNKTTIKILEKHNVPGREEAIEILKNISGKSYQIMRDNLTDTENYFMVFNHGDYWTNNMMFLKNDEGKILHHKAIDFQITRYNSPAIDLAYYMYTSVKPEVRRQHLQEFLHLYLNTLKTTAAQLGHEIQLEYDEFYAQFRKKLKYGFWFGFSMASEAGYAVMKEVDLHALTNLEDWAVQIDTAVGKWIDANTVKVRELAENIVLLLQEYVDLVLD